MLLWQPSQKTLKISSLATGEMQLVVSPPSSAAGQSRLVVSLMVQIQSGSNILFAGHYNVLSVGAWELWGSPSEKTDIVIPRIPHYTRDIPTQVSFRGMAYFLFCARSRDTLTHGKPNIISAEMIDSLRQTWPSLSTQVQVAKYVTVGNGMRFSVPVNDPTVSTQTAFTPSMRLSARGRDSARIVHYIQSGTLRSGNPSTITPLTRA